VILTEEQLRAVGETIGRGVGRPVFFALRGELGAGKSVFARAVARGAGVEGTVPSPTFNLRFDHPLPDGGQLVHMDLYRLSEVDEIWELAWEDLGAAGELALVEWPGRAEPFLPVDRWEVRLAPVPGHPLRREVKLAARGDPAPLPLLPEFEQSSRGEARP
jgi:tRNA threonylcarbamoyl adenosine modification protein YjeE